ncbi:hypothetical protein F444_12848 [Phytophthora nicotianae P1976]|uniref:Uncharacterized protein n=1 Tax=Phytophthora nicotianae P1976 TaxID=1317066 RepID=A0A080ZVN3_PHYNI|nr:hypothetical protein F444_12848 [Phytophthora nicotianae P1976]
MKTCIDERFAEDASITPVALFGIISKKISRLTLDGPPPLLSQVQSHTKKWHMIFRDMNNLHDARNEDEYLKRRSFILASWR